MCVYGENAADTVEKGGGWRDGRAVALWLERQRRGRRECAVNGNGGICRWRWGDEEVGAGEG